jgi:hypothetical protein
MTMSILLISASDGLDLSHLNMLLVENVPEGVSRIGALEGNWGDDCDGNLSSFRDKMRAEVQQVRIS